MEVDELEKIKLGISLELEAFIESLERMPIEWNEGCSHIMDIIQSRLQTLGEKNDQTM